MAMKASAQTIRDMKKQIGQTVKDIEHINQGIRSGIRATGSWDDAKAAEFNMLMQKIARLTVSPVETLNAAMHKLERLAQTVDSYNSTKMGR